jgi:hypothetical protein
VPKTADPPVVVRRVHAIDAIAAGASVVASRRDRKDLPHGVVPAAAERRTEARRVEQRRCQL